MNEKLCRKWLKMDKNKKLIAIDLDGTTLDNHSILTSETEQTLKALRDEGHIIAIATGRPYRTSYQYYNQLELDTPIVNFNGAWAHHPQNKDWKYGYHKFLEKEIALSFLALRDLPFVRLLSAESKNTLYVDRLGEETYSNGPSIKKFNPKLFTAKNLSENPTAVNVFSHFEENLPYIQEQILDDYNDTIEIRTWGGLSPALEIVSKGIQKAMGIEAIAKSYGISQKDIIAFGDEANDYEMIQYAGHGVVMKNAINSLKEISDDITPHTNHENGLSNYLQKYFDMI